MSFIFPAGGVKLGQLILGAPEGKDQLDMDLH